MSDAVPKRTDLGYLRGWFLVKFKGDHRKAKAAALKFKGEALNRQSGGEHAQSG